MKIINTNDDLDILLSWEEVSKIGYVENPGTQEESRGRLETVAINSPITIGTPKKKIALELGQAAPRRGRWIESYRENDTLVLRVHGLWGSLNQPNYNEKPIQDRYDFENKAIIYSIFNLPDHLKHFFEVS